MSAPALLAELEAAGVLLSLAGDDLRFQTRPGVSIAPYRERISAHKPALLTLPAPQDEMVRTASAAQDAIDRIVYDQLWATWHALQDEGACL